MCVCVCVCGCWTVTRTEQTGRANTRTILYECHVQRIVVAAAAVRMSTSPLSPEPHHTSYHHHHYHTHGVCLCVCALQRRRMWTSCGHRASARAVFVQSGHVVADNVGCSRLLTFLVWHRFTYYIDRRGRHWEARSRTSAGVEAISLNIEDMSIYIWCHTWCRGRLYVCGCVSLIT